MLLPDVWLFDHQVHFPAGLTTVMAVAAMVAVTVTIGATRRHAVKGTPLSRSSGPLLGVVVIGVAVFAVVPTLYGVLFGSAQSDGDDVGYHSVPPTPTPTASPSPNTSGRSVSAGHVDVSGLVTVVLWVLVAAVVGALLAGAFLLARRVTRQVLAARAARRAEAERIAGLQAEWDALQARESRAMTAFLRYDRDPEALLRLPMMRDYSDPLIVSAVEAMNLVRGLSTSAPPAGTVRAGTSDYARAVAGLETAVAAAERTAERVRLSRFAPGERRRILRAQQLLAVALDGGASAAERQSAYKRVVAELDGLIVLPEPARAAIESAMDAHLVLPVGR